MKIYLKKISAWHIFALIFVAILVLDPQQGKTSLLFLANALIGILPFLLFAICFMAFTSATSLDNIIATSLRAKGKYSIIIAAIIGGLSPFCSCGVIPLIAALLRMRVPLSAVMAFWLASPITDPAIFALTYSVIDLDFAIARTLAAIGIGIFGGSVIYALNKKGYFTNPLKPEISTKNDNDMLKNKQIIWHFWQHKARKITFINEFKSTFLFLIKWLSLAFLLESLMIAYIANETIIHYVGGQGIIPIATATLVGIPAYLNGFAALPLVKTMMDQGMSHGAALGFMLGGAVSSMPAAIAVYALVKKPVFIAYISLAMIGAFTSALMFQTYINWVY
ncbi:MAG: permease [Rhizobiales bacterium]|nr:permease [Hyphomicrobiales bacterium]